LPERGLRAPNQAESCDFFGVAKNWASVRWCSLLRTKEIHDKNQISTMTIVNSLVVTALLLTQASHAFTWGGDAKDPEDHKLDLSAYSSGKVDPNEVKVDYGGKFFNHAALGTGSWV